MKLRIYVMTILVVILQRQCVTEGSNKKKAEDYFSQHQVVVPEVYNKRGEEIFSTLNENGHAHDITVVVPLTNSKLLLDLHINRHLFPDTYIEKHVTSEGAKIINPSNKKALHCYYHGSARGYKHSVAAVSTCDGIRATVYLSSDTLHLEPKSSVINGDHLLFRDSHQIPVNYTCGVNSVEKSNVFASPHQRLKRGIRWPAGSNRNTKIVELYVVNDYKQYLAYDQNESKVVKRTKEVINAASALYKSIDIHIALVAIETWKEQNQITITEDAEQTMKNFLEYRKTNINHQHKNDNSQLLTDHTFGEGVIGKAPINTMCSWQYSGGVNMDHHALVGPVATTIAHEMGHNFGLAHDDADCSCPESRCIMNRNSGGNQPNHWSSCSKEQFEDAFHQGMDYCLHDLPDELFQPPVCGNGFKEDGEECDCGTPDSCDSKCCDAATCTLFSNATCATGACCNLKTCKLRKRSTPCRKPVDECDLGEHCKGTSEFCPSDAYIRDGTECKASGQQSYCYKGRCRNHESQCQLLWGNTGHNSADICYSYNRLNIPNGNCGFHWIDKTFDACAQEDVMCGMLHCRHRAEKLKFWQEPLSYTMPESILPDEQGNMQQCYGAILDVGLDYQDPGMVPDGAKCGHKQMCIDAKCTSISELDLKSCPSCHGNGVCNNLGQCHCDIGYGEPTCKRSGDGGSKHSGPIKPFQSNRGLMIGLVLLFVVIIPIVGALVFIGYRHREEIKKICFTGTRQDKYRSIFRARPGNACDSATSRAVPRPPPKRPTAPPAAKEIAVPDNKPHATGIKRAASFSPSDIGAFKFESTTNKQLAKMDEIPVRYRSPTLEQARSNRPLSYPSSYQEEEVHHSRQDEFAHKPTRPAPTRPTPTRPAPARPMAPSVGAHGSINTQTKPERPPQPDLSKIGRGHHGNDSVATVASLVPTAKQAEPVSQMDNSKYYQNVPKTQHYANEPFSNSALPSYHTSPHPSTVSNMVNKFQQPSGVLNSDNEQQVPTFEHTSSILGSAENKRPVPRPRSIAQTGQQGLVAKKPELPRKPPASSNFSASRFPSQNTGSKPTTTPKPVVNTGVNRNNSSMC